MMKKSEGFSLIELLVVVAIIGVLASVGIVGYSQYIENTKADVARTNAQGVERWLTSTQLARSGGLTVDPNECSTTDNGSGGLEHCFQQLTSTTLGTSNNRNGPFSTFSNPYQAQAGAPIIHYRDNGSTALDNGSGGSTDPGAGCDNTTGTNQFTAYDDGSGTSTAPTDYRGVILIQLLDDADTDNMSDTTNRIRVGYCNLDSNFVEVADNISF
jgi:prepilin-type N-terminal cleavage/methylation domain-containing protein